MNKDNLIILLGPTAVGKTELSIDLAKRLDGEIISCDSMQIYKHMTIGSAKIKEEEMQGIPHYLVDFLDPREEFTVSDYKKKAEEYIRDINSRGKIPIVTGGTGLYINSLVYDLNFTKVEANLQLRNDLENYAKEEGNQALHDRLRKIDPESAERIHPNDVKRVIRAIEIYEESGKTMTEYNANFRSPVTKYNLAMIGLNMDRQKLYDRVNKRVDIMVEDGLIEEVQSILDMGYDPELVALQGIGYKELIMHLEGDMKLEDSLDLIKKNSRNYAKRQLTWFRRDDRIKWYNKDEYENDKDLCTDIVEYTKNIIK